MAIVQSRREQRVGRESASKDWNADHRRYIIGEESDKKQSPFMLDGSKYNKRIDVCLKRLDKVIVKKKRTWPKQQKADTNMLQQRNQLTNAWQKLLQEHFEKEIYLR